MRVRNSFHWHYLNRRMRGNIIRKITIAGVGTVSDGCIIVIGAATGTVHIRSDGVEVCDNQVQQHWVNGE